LLAGNKVVVIVDGEDTQRLDVVEKTLSCLKQLGMEIKIVADVEPHIAGKHGLP
jgi:alcohol dehydrogenase class IV